MDPITLVSILIIICFFLVVLFRLLNSSSHLKDILKEFKKIERIESDYSEKIESDGDFESSSSAKISYDRRLLEQNRVDFNKVYAKYVSHSQMIALFPLLGILGTVFGLMMSGTGNGTGTSNIEQMLSGLDTALYTTFAGLVASIVLKLIDAKSAGQLVNIIDAKFNEVDGAINRLTLEKILSSNSIEERNS